MKQLISQKKNASVSYGLGVAKIVVGIPVVFFSLMLLLIINFWFRVDNSPYHFVRIMLGLLFAAGGTAGGFLIYSGINSCGSASIFRKISAAMEYKNREKLNVLAGITGQDLTCLVRDLRKMADKAYFPTSYVDLGRGEFVLASDNCPAPMLADGDIILREKVRPSLAPLLAIPAVTAVYSLIRPFGSWIDLAAAGAISIVIIAVAYLKKPTVRTIVEQTYKAPPPSKPVPVDTGNGELDEFLTRSIDYMGELNTAALAITNEKMAASTAELLNISRQIFAFVEKQPEKLRQTRQFMNYYLPTTIKLLSSYGELSRQPLKGDSIKEAMAKIEGSMDGIVETFRRELDSLYSDKAVDISVDVDLMLAMMRSQGFKEDFGGQEPPRS